ncbi:hypothetical protein [Escherichia coli]|uniref:hypothetical protein n=1 Tax=Escherichia coli TaxID=562 RepID=UPI0032DAD10E
MHRKKEKYGWWLVGVVMGKGKGKVWLVALMGMMADQKKNKYLHIFLFVSVVGGVENIQAIQHFKFPLNAYSISFFFKKRNTPCLHHGPMGHGTISNTFSRVVAKEGNHGIIILHSSLN